MPTFDPDIDAAVQELRDQGLTVTNPTPQDMIWIVEDKAGESYILTSFQLWTLKRGGNLNIAGIRQQILEQQRAISSSRKQRL